MRRRRSAAGDAPLLAWGESLRTEKRRRVRLHGRILLVGAGTLILLLSAALPPAPRLLWNASASAPIGLYVVAPGALVDPDDTVVARVPRRYRLLAASRGYLPMNVPLVKRVAAYAGDEVCALGKEIVINGRWIASRRAVDAAGLPMPWWSGCVVLRGRQLLLLMDSPSSFDGRYFGPTDGQDVIGKARLLWRR